MKRIKLGSVIITLLFIATFSNLNSQTQHWDIPFPETVFVPCADDGNGEFLTGDLTIYFVLSKTGIIAHPHGGYLIGSVTGDKYRAAGSETTRWSPVKENGAEIFTIVQRRRFVSKEANLLIKTSLHVITYPDGEVKVTMDNSEVICK